MKIAVLLGFLLISFGAKAGEIYIYKDANDGTYLSNRKSDNGLSHIKTTHYPDILASDWNYNCSKDKFNGRRSCSLNKAHSDVMVSIFDGRHSVYVGRNHFPRTQSAIKIDNNAPVYGREGSSNTPQKVIEQMKKGKVAYTRYKEWPYEYNQDGETDLTGFAEKYNEMLEEYKKL